MSDHVTGLDGCDQELWRDVPSLAGLYQASSLGRIRSVRRFRESKNRHYGGQVLALTPNPNGYLKFQACMGDGVELTTLVSRSVCEAFHGPPPVGRGLAAHGDGNILNNRPTNLRWASRYENADDAVSHGTVTSGERNRHAKLNPEKVAAIQSAAVADRDAVCAAYNISRSHFYLLRRGEAWSDEGRRKRRERKRQLKEGRLSAAT